MGRPAKPRPVAPTASKVEWQGDRQSVMFRVRGMPKAQPRPRFKNGSGSVVSTTGREAKAWRLAVWAEVQRLLWDWRLEIQDVISERPVEVEMWFLMPTRDQRRFGLACGSKPDVDNLAKLVLDVMVAGDGTIRRGAGLLADDARVADLVARKRWCRPEDAGVVVTVKPVGVDLEGPFAGDGEMPAWLTPVPEKALSAECVTRPVRKGAVDLPTEL